MMSEAMLGPSDRMVVWRRDLENSASCLPDAMLIWVQRACDGARVSASGLFQGAPVCPLDAPEFGR